MSVNQTEGVSVYVRKDIAERERSSLYDAARELVRKVHGNGTVLDLGCSDLVASRILMQEGYRVVGADLDRSALRRAHGNAADARVIQADARHLPFDYESSDITTVLALDVIEHFRRPEALEVLRGIRALPNIKNVIVTMPIHSIWSIPLMIEALRAVRQMRMPETGLLDRTHKIFTDQAGHRRLFEESGFIVDQEETTNWFEGVTGSWDNVFQTRPGFRRLHARLFEKAVWDVIPKMVHPLDRSRRRQVTDRLIAYQGMYLLSAAE